MSRSRINFAHSGWRRYLAELGVANYLTAVILVAMLAALANTGRNLLWQFEAQEKKLGHLRNEESSKKARAKPAPVRTAIPAAQAISANTAISQLNLPWRDVFLTIEAATPKTIALVSLEPDAKNSALKGIAEAKTTDEMIAYIEQLKKEDFFSQVQLLKHEVVELDPNRPYRFQFEVQWARDKR